MSLQISDKVKTLAAQAQADIRPQFDRIDAIAEENTAKVLAAFQKHRVSEAHFAGTTGYGYDDLGRDTLDLIFAELFHTEDALVRVQFVNGTHAISCALFGALKPGDVLVSAVGAPYDTMLGVIGVVDKGPGSGEWLRHRYHPPLKYPFGLQFPAPWPKCPAWPPQRDGKSQSCPSP